MKAESWVFGGLTVFLIPVTPIYYLMSRDPTGTAALIMCFFLVLMVFGYLSLIARRMNARPEDRQQAEITEGAGELGFFPPQSIWPFYCALSFAMACMGPVFGWWLTILGIGISVFTVTGLVFQYYRGDHAH